MAELPIRGHTLKYRPASAPRGHDAYRWHIHLEDQGAAVDYLVVDLSASQAIKTGLSAEELEARLEAAVQQLAAGRLDNYLPVLEQVAGWPAPVVLQAEHFA